MAKAAPACRDVPPVHPIVLGGDYNGGRGLRMADKIVFIGFKTHLHELEAEFYRLVENVPPVHPIALAGDLNGRRGLFRMADKADAPGVHPYQRGKVAPTKFAHDGIADGTNSSARWTPIRSGIFLGRAG